MTQLISATILFGQPQSEDAFPGGGHSRSAKALVTSINQIAQNGIDTGQHGGGIGLEGGWGSGKSSIIRMAESELPAHFEVFTLDMWAHQTDSFRRSVLEELLNHIEANAAKWPDVDVEAERDIVQSRRRQVTDKTRKIYTPLGALLLLSLPLIAVLFAWIQPSAVGNTKLGNLPTLAIWGTALVLLAAVIMLTVLFFKADPKGKAGWWARMKARFALAVSEFFTLSRDVNSQTTTQSIREEDPTTAEFGRIFRALLAKLQRGDRRLVMVLDNVDRLPEDQVKNAWSEMRALFAERAASADRSVIVIVPYDRKHISAAFGIDTSGNLPGDNDIFDKTFDRIISVAAPVPSDWRGYLDAQLDKALVPSLNSAQREKLFRLFKLFLTAKKVRVTPRRILAYVNDIGALRVQWGDAIPVEAMALYSLHRHGIEAADNVIGAINGIETSFQSVLDIDDWRKYLAALVFNVDPDHANQVLFEPVIAAGLVGKASDQLRAASGTPGFWEVFQDVISNSIADWIAAGPQTIAAVAVNLSDLAPAEHLARPAWRELAKAFEGLDLAPHHTALFGDLAMVVAQQQEGRKLDLARSLERALIQDGAPSSDTEDQELGKAWGALASAVAAQLRSSSALKDEQEYIASLSMPARAGFVLGVIEHCTMDPTLPFERLDPILEPETVGEAMLDLLGRDPAKYVVVQPIATRVYAFEAEQHLLIIAQNLQSLTGDSKSYLLAAMQYCRWHPEEVKSSLQASWKDGTLAWHFNHGVSEKDAEVTAAAILVSLVVNASQVPAGRAQNSNLPDVATAVAAFNTLFESDVVSLAAEKTLGAYTAAQQEFRTLFSAVLSAGENAEAFQSALRYCLEVPQQSPPLKLVTGRYAELEATVGQEVALSFLNRAAFDEGELARNVKKLDFSDISDHFLLAASKEESGNWGRLIVSKIDDALAALDDVSWIALLSDPANSLLRLLIVRQDNGGKPIGGTSFVNSVVEMAARTISGEFDPASVPRFELIEKSLPTASRRQAVTLVQTRLATLSASTASALRFVRHYPLLAGDLKYDRDADGTLLSHLVWFLVASTDKDAVAYIDDNAGKIKKALAQAEPTIGETFGQAIADLAASDPDRGDFLQTALLGKKNKRAKEPSSGE